MMLYKYAQLVAPHGSVVRCGISMVLLVIARPAALAADPPGQTLAESVKQVRLYQRGKATELKLSEQTLRLAQECEETLEEASGILKLAVSDETTARLKRNETVVEIIYRNPRPIAVAVSKTIINAAGLLVPLSGEYAENAHERFVTVFYALPRESWLSSLVSGPIGYVSGPYRSSAHHHDKLRLLVDAAAKLAK